MSADPRPADPRSPSTARAEYVRGLDAIEAKWEAREDQLKAELADLPRWRFYRRSMVQAELQGINRGMLNLIFRRIAAQNGLPIEEFDFDA